MKQKLPLFIVLLIALALPNVARAYDFSCTYQGKTLFYTITDSYNHHVRVDNPTNGNYYSYVTGDVVIPDSVEYNGIVYAVTNIGYYAFNECSGLTSVTIPNSFTSIGNWAFYGCSGLTSVTIPNSVTSIGNYAFEYCSSLTSVTIPNSVTSIGNGAFYGCSGLTSVTIPNSVTSIWSDAFYYVRHIEYYGSASGSPWGAISMNGYAEGNFVYSDSTKTNLLAYIGTGGNATIPNSVTSIGSSAFYNCSSLTSVTIPNSVTSIGNNAFYNCSSLTTVNFNATNCTSMGDSYYQVFSRCTNLTTLNIGGNVTNIPNYAFCYCSSLTSVSIPNSVTSIGSSAFAYCSGLISVTIGNSVISIDSSTFYYCSGLTSIVVSNGNTYYDSRDSCNAIIQTSTNTLLVGCQNTIIPNSVTSIGNAAFLNCSGLTSLTIPNSVSSIGNRAFRYCRSLTSVTIPNSVTSIGSAVFDGCHSLTSVTIPNSVTSIGNSAFDCCYSLTSVIIPNSVTFIGDNAFMYCSSLTSVIIGNSVTSIGDWAFGACGSLTSVTIGNSVTSIGNWAFRNCSDLTEITSLAAVVPSLGNGVFTNVPSSIPINIPCGSTSSYRSTWNYFSNFVEPYVPDIAVQSANSTMGVATIMTQPSCDYIAVIEATANYGYHFTQWSDGVVDNPRTLMLTQDTSITAMFSNNVYEITALPANATMGSVTVSDSQIDYLDTVVITAIPNYGYHFTTWSDGVTDNPRIEVVTGYASYNALFEHNQYDIELTVDTNIHGAVSGAGSSNYLSERIISATPNYGYHFTMWDDGDTNNPRSITLTQDTAFTAQFAKNLYTLTALSADSVRGTVTGGETVEYLDTVVLSASANYGYHFAQWNDGNSDNPRSLVLTRDAVYTAQFDKNNYSLSVTTADSVMGGVSGSNTAEYFDAMTFLATPNYGYHFTMWNDGDTNNPRVITLTHDTAFAALFAKNFYTLTALSADSVRGTVTGGETVEYLDTVVLSASANYGYHFAQWNDGNSDNPRSLVVTQDAVYTAQFDKNSYTLSVATADSVMGDVSGSDTAEYLDIISFAATANYGYHFTMWNDGDTNNPRSITLTQDTGFTAMFAKNLYTLTVLANDTTLGEVMGSTTAEYLDTVSITATVTMPHYHFVQWSDGSAETTRNVVMTCDSVITAIFAIDTHTVTLMVNDDEYGTVSGACSVPYGTEVVIVATANESYHFAEWSNGSRNNPENITVLNDTTLTAVFTEVVVPEIYMVTVQDGRNVVIWEKGLEVTAYNIYREGSASDVYDLVATIPYSEEPVWTDTASRPRNRSYRYRMTATDLYGYESDPGGVHKTMHLTISQGVGNEWNLVWTPYEGADYSTYVIYRGTNASNIQQIDVMPSNGNTTYTDDGAPEGTVYYQVGILLSGSTKSGDIILSNIATNETVGIHDITEVGNFNVSICNGQIVVDGAEGNQVWLYDAVGRMIATKQEDSAPIRFNVSASGTYLVKVGNYPARRVVVIR